MHGLAKKAPRAQGNHACCSGCGLCLLVCPAWRRHRDIGLTALGRAKALQHGAGAADIADSIQSCTLCAACERVCPEEIGLVGMTLDLRRQLAQPALMQQLHARMEQQAARPNVPRPSSPAMLLPGQALRNRPTTLARAAALLGGAGNISLADDDGSDVALALEAGAEIPVRRLERFLQPLRGLAKIIVADGLLLRHLRQWLPGPKIASLGVALSGLATVRARLRASDLYVIEPRAYHADYQRLVKYYDALRLTAGCTLNLDLQRIAIPATAPSLPLGQAATVDSTDNSTGDSADDSTGDSADDCTGDSADDSTGDSVQASWILKGRNIARIVVESVEDGAAFERASHRPVVHLADLADDGIS